MNKQQIEQMWDHFRQVNGIGLRCIAAIPPGKIDANPIPGMRTPKEIAVHMYGTMVQAVIESIVSGSLAPPDEARICQTLRTGDELLSYCRGCWEAGDRAMKSVTDRQLQAMVKTPWGMDMPGFVMASVTYDEYFHHRGQLYAYLRAMGIEPPMLWDFGHNEPAYQPKPAA